MGRPTGSPQDNLRRFLGELVASSRAGESQSDLARRLMISPAAVSTRLKRLRAKGFRLPELGSSVTSKQGAESILAELFADETRTREERQERLKPWTILVGRLPSGRSLPAEMAAAS
jgi:hypothetical protein